MKAFSRMIQRPLLALLLGASIRLAAGQDIVINEIMFHPLQTQFRPEPLGEEFVELFNSGTNAVDLTGWRFTKGLEFTFTNVVLQPKAYVVVSPNLAVFRTKHPGVNNVVGNFAGTLGNNGETITLKNAAGDVVDSVTYGTEGDWAVRQLGSLDLGHRGWKWFNPASGGGKSMERRNPFLKNTNGQNWAFSAVNGGSPGAENSAYAVNVAPLILDLAHSPVAPRSTDSVAITARIVDELASGMAVSLFWRKDAATPAAFTRVQMFDDGAHGDGARADGVYGAIIPPQLNDSVIEFYVQASDLSGRLSTWPRAVIPAADGGVAAGQAANALYQVDDNSLNAFGALSTTQPVYKLIMTENERAELAGIPCSNSQDSNAEMNGTFISIDGRGAEIRYNAGFRNRGHFSRCNVPPNYNVNIPDDNRWHGVQALTMNAANPVAQVLGAAVFQRSGIAGADSHPGQVRVNNVNQANAGPAMLGAYAVNEALNSDWTRNHYPLDSGGNIYRMLRDIAPPDWVYRGENPGSYTNTYFKQDNTSAYDWSDLIQLHRIVGTNDLFTTDNVRKVVDVEEWLRYYAVQSIIGNSETDPNTGYNDDYTMYRNVLDQRFRLSYYDNDSILSPLYQARPATDGIFSAELNNGMGEMATRFLEWPDFKPLYYATLQSLLNTVFSKPVYDQLVEGILASYPNTVPRATVLASLKSWMDTRRATIQNLIQGQAPTDLPRPSAVISGEPRPVTPSTAATLRVSGAGVVAYEYSLNGGPYSAEFLVSEPIRLSGLPNNSTNTVSVIGRPVSGFYQEVPTVSKTWVVRTDLPSVRLNEVLARNAAGVNQNGAFPDLVELYNEGNSAVDLSGMGMSANKNNPDKFVFPANTTIPAGGYLVLIAGNADGSPGLHLGFALNQSGDELYLFDTAARGGRVVDSVSFGNQLQDLSIGRVNGDEWVLCLTTFGSANIAAPVALPTALKLNEWLASGTAPIVDDFLEIVNQSSTAVNLGGLYLTSEPIGAPRLHRITDLTFVPGSGFLAFKADGNTGAGPDHLSFGISADGGKLALLGADLSVIDYVSPSPARSGISEGRCPDGGSRFVLLNAPTPGGPNFCPPVQANATNLTLLPYSANWRYEEISSLDATPWTSTNFNDNTWVFGPGIFGAFSGNAPAEPVRTRLSLGRNTYYFRTTFTLASKSNLAGLFLYHYIDDGAVVYLNGQEVYRYRMPSGKPTYATLATANINVPAESAPVALPLDRLVIGQNYLAVEVHQFNPTSNDIFMGAKLDAVIVPEVASTVGSGLVINEILAQNDTLPESDGTTPDWIELYNPSNKAVDLAGMSLSGSTSNPRRWVFPSPSIIPAQSQLVIRFDDGAPASAANTGWGLNANGDSVYLFNKPADGGGVLDAVTFGLQLGDYSIGRYPQGTTNWALTLPTPGRTNAVAPLGSQAKLKVNEWMPNPSSGDDWFEIYNPEPQPVALGGLWLSDDLASAISRQKSLIPALSFVGAATNGFQQFHADGNAGAGANHVNFSLSASGESVGISTPAGALIDGVSFGALPRGVSQGRLPDGALTIATFTDTASPGEMNYLSLTNIVINEVLTHTDPPLEDAIELLNTNSVAVDISGWVLSDSKENLKKFSIPQGTIIPPNAYKVFYETQFNAGPGLAQSFSLSSAHGDQVYLSASQNGALTGYRAQVKFGAAQNGVSFGRYRTSTGAIDFTAMNERTFGSDTPATLEEFRAGTGKANSGPKIGPVVFSEVMYHPAPLGTNDNTRDEFIELQNISNGAVTLYDPLNATNQWRLRGGVDFDFPPNVTLAAGAKLVLVGFDPSTDTAALAAFKDAYKLTGDVKLYGPWQGKLDNGSDSLELYRPDAPQLPPLPDAGFVPFILVDRVVYSDTAPWDARADGTGLSLQRISATAYGNDPASWTAAAPNPSPTSGSTGNRDTDNDGMPDAYELANGFDPNNAADAAQDADGDGLTNLQEYTIGTNPRDPNSFLRLNISLTSTPGTLKLSFLAPAKRGFQIQRSATLQPGSWDTYLVLDPNPVSSGMVELNVSSSGKAMFYRVVTQ